MQRITFLLSFFMCTIFSQSLPDTWSQSYCTYESAVSYIPGDYAFGFSINNFTLYTYDPDSFSYDTRRFDLFGRVGVFKNGEFEIKYSSPTCGVVSLKYQFWKSPIDAAFKFGFGYMKGTRRGFVTDYVFDFYPTFILTKKITEKIRLFYAPKIIYSIHLRDRQEHSERPPRYIFQYGHGLGLVIGDKFSILPESNWLFSDNMGIKYTVNQFGLGVIFKFSSLN